MIKKCSFCGTELKLVAAIFGDENHSICDACICNAVNAIFKSMAITKKKLTEEGVTPNFTFTKVED